MDRFMVYLIIIVFFGVLSAICGLVLYISRYNIGLKFKSIYARKTGKILVKFLDENDGYHEEFVHIKERTVTVHPTWLEGQGIVTGIDPAHIYHDSSYGIRAININPRGSYKVTGIEQGQQVDQAYLDGVLADKMVKRALSSPTDDNQMLKLIKWILYATIGGTGVGVMTFYMVYQIYKILQSTGGGGVL